MYCIGLGRLHGQIYRNVHLYCCSVYDEQRGSFVSWLDSGCRRKVQQSHLEWQLAWESQPFACYTEPAMPGSRWTHWLTWLELYADGNGLIITTDATAVAKQRRQAEMRALPNMEAATDYTASAGVLNRYFVPQVSTAFVCQMFHKLYQKQGETVKQFSAHLKQTVKDCDFRAETDEQTWDAILSTVNAQHIMCTENDWRTDMV